MTFKAESKKHSHPITDTLVVKILNLLTNTVSGSCAGYWAPRWQRHSETTAIKILCNEQAASLFSRCSNAVKNVLFCSFCTPMYASQLWCNFRKSYMQTLRVAYNLGCRALYTTCPGERLLVVMTHQVQCNISTSEAVLRKNMHLFLERCRKSNNVMAACFDAVRLFIFFLILWTLQPHFTLWLSARTLQCFFVWGCACHNALVLYLGLTSLGISVSLSSSVVPSEQSSVKNAPVNLRLGLQRRYKTFCSVNFCSPVSSEISDLLFFVSYFASQSKGIKFGDYFFMCVV